MRPVPKGERDHQLLSERPSCKLNALSPLRHSMYSWFPPHAALTRPSVRPLFLNQQEYPVSAPPTNQQASSTVSQHGAGPASTPSLQRQRGFCLSVDSFPSLHSRPNPSSLSTDDDAATTSPSTPTRSSSRSRGANLMTYCRHCSRGLTKKAKFSHNVP